MSNVTPCKICGSKTRLAFNRGWSGHSQTFPYHCCINPQCNFLYTNYLDDLSDAEMSAIYENSYWDDKNREACGSLSVDKATLALVLLPNAKKVLDIGSGEGWGVSALRQAGFEAYGYDIISPKVCQEYIITGDRKNVTDTYDIVTAIEVLEHLIDPIDTCLWVSSLLKEGGVFAFSTYTFSPRQHDVNWWYLDHVGHVSLHTRSSLRLLAKVTGFRVVTDIFATHIWVRGNTAPITAPISIWSRHLLKKLLDSKSYKFVMWKLLHT